MDFTPYLQQNIPRFYGGSNGNKRAIQLENNNIYMLKFPPIAKDTQNLSYSNSTISEYISCQIIESMGLEVQKTRLGKVNIEGKEKIVVACQDFTQDDSKLYEFAMIKNGCICSSQNGYGTELSTILSAIEEQTIYPPEKVKDYFWDLFILDAFLGNFDRHNGNWGFLINEKTGEIKLAPIFDCGSCLFPQLDDEMMEKILQDEKEMELRIYQFPNSALKEEDKKINYFGYISSLANQDTNEALKRIFPKIELKKVNSIIEKTPFISKIRKQFYQEILTKRYEKILEYSYHKLYIQESKEKEGMN